MNVLTDFINCTLYPAMFEHVPELFPALSFRKVGRSWHSPYRLDGSEPTTRKRADKTVITWREPDRALEQSENHDNIKLIDLYCMHNGYGTAGADLFRALQEIADICGVLLPESTPEAKEAHRRHVETQGKLEDLTRRMNEALLSGREDAAPVLEYLTVKRGYDLDFIRWAKLGFVAPEFVGELKELLKSQWSGKSTGLIGCEYVMAIPYTNGGDIKGFAVRRFDGVTPKYSNIFLTREDTQGYHLFGLNPADITRDSTLTDLLIVEGPLDALRAKYKGVAGVAALDTGQLAENALEEAKRMGIRSFTFLFDLDVDDNGRWKDEVLAGRIRKTIGKIKAEGLTAFFAFFPENNGQKVDADEYLKTHSGEDLIELFRNKVSATMYFFDRAAKKYKGENYDHTLTDPEREAFRAELMDLCSDTGTTPIERRTIAERFASYLGGGVTPEDVAAELAEVSSLRDIATEKANAESKRAGLKRMAKRIEYMIENGDVLGAMAYAYNEANRLNDEKKKTTIGENAFKQCSFEEILEELKSEPEGLHTGITLFNPNASNPMEASEELIIPAGQLTYVAAPSSHGKSRMMENLALYIAAEDRGPGNVLYFSLEESKASVMVQFLNLYHNEELSLNNCKTIKEYLKTGSTTHFKHGASISHLQESIKNFSKLMNSGKLQIYYPGRDTTAIIENIIEKHKENPVKAVFIDYVQILHQGDGYGSKKEMIMQICLSLMPVAVESGIPIILGAQFNREVRTPLDMDLNKLGDASDIEQSANTLIMMFGSWKKKTAMGKSNNYLDGGGKLTPEGEALLARGFEPGKFGKLYVELGKNRGGIVGLNAVLDFNGNTGKIQNSAEDRGPETEAAEPVTGSSTKRDPDDIFGE